MIMFDANMILRYMLNDIPEMAQKAEDYIVTGEVLVSIEVIAEVVYVLRGVYKLNKDTVSDTIKKFLKLVNCQEEAVMSMALSTFAIQNLDFIDCVLYAYNRIKGIEIATFDKKLFKLISEG